MLLWFWVWAYSVGVEAQDRVVVASADGCPVGFLGFLRVSAWRFPLYLVALLVLLVVDVGAIAALGTAGGWVIAVRAVLMVVGLSVAWMLVASIGLGVLMLWGEMDIAIACSERPALRRVDAGLRWVSRHEDALRFAAGAGAFLLFCVFYYSYS